MAGTRPHGPTGSQIVAQRVSQHVLGCDSHQTLVCFLRQPWQQKVAPLTIAYKGDASRPILPARALAHVLTVASELDTRREDRLAAEENDDLTP